jgi:hypothetical protein
MAHMAVLSSVKVKTFFTTRRLRTRPRNIREFETFAKSRLALATRSIDFELHIDFPISITSQNIRTVASSATPCRIANKCLDPLCSTLISIFEHAFNVKSSHHPTSKIVFK